MNPFESFVLDNGLTVYLYQNSKRHSTFFQFVTLFGAETKDFMLDSEEYHLPDGLAHLLEHYLVECNACGNFLKELGEAQMSTNAYTYYHMTRFYFETVENLEYGIQTLLKGIYSPIFSEENLERIKGPIYQEIRGEENSKLYHARRKILDSLFQKNQFRSILGTVEEVQKISLEEVRLCYQAFYQPKNQFIVVGGNFDKEHVLREIKMFYQTIPFSSSVQVIKKPEPLSVKVKHSTLFFPTGKDYTLLAYKVPLSSFSPKEKVTLDFYIQYFFDMYFRFSSSLYQQLVQEKIITGSIAASSFVLGDFLVILIGAYTDQGRLFEQKVQDTILRLDSFDSVVFDLDKKSTLLEIILREESLSSMILPFVDNISEFQYFYPDTKEDVLAFQYEKFKKMICSLNFKNFSVLTIQNPVEKKKNEL